MTSVVIYDSLLEYLNVGYAQLPGTPVDGWVQDWKVVGCLSRQREYGFFTDWIYDSVLVERQSPMDPL